ncbi:hypothetical protein [Streptomyces sp. NPDC057460]|uniref:hypothetical protein n=1 Tax=Streptomyces sp. NPDC057460 TaxID=3346141 RepID=UPI00369B0CB1
MANSFRAVNIALVNELAEVARAQVPQHAAEAASADRGNQGTPHDRYTGRSAGSQRAAHWPPAAGMRRFAQEDVRAGCLGEGGDDRQTTAALLLALRAAQKGSHCPRNARTSARMKRSWVPVTRMNSETVKKRGTPLEPTALCRTRREQPDRNLPSLRLRQGAGVERPGSWPAKDPPEIS